MAKYFSRHGVTSFLATTWSDPNEATLKVISNLAGLVGPIKGGARLLGVHLEGPYLNPQKVGAHEPGYIRIAETVEVEQFFETGIVKLVTLAPEIPENLRAVEKFVRRGITVSIGHSNATFEQVNTAFERGLSHATHTFNAMGGFGHREPGTVGAVMSIPGIKCELISDNIHVHPASQKVLFQVKGPEGVILVTDAARGTGLPDGDYLYGSRNVHIQSGAARLMDGTLAGSTLTMERALNNAIAASGWPLRDAWPMSSLNAARQVNISNRKGSIETGKDADIILLDADFNVILTMVEGRVAYSIMQDF
jgi:N-acetylglucosamine-6-phosphate deacetylase